MAERGYLWEHLGEDVRDEFASLTEVAPSLEEQALLAASRDVHYRLWATKDVAEMPKEIRRALDRRNSWPTCSKGKCTRPKTLGTKLCAYHREITNRAMRKYDERKRGMREKPAPEREGINHKFSIMALTENGQIVEHDGYLHMNTYPDGRLSEVFVRLGKPGDEHAWIDHWAMATSYAIQFGAPIDELFMKLVATRFKPFGPTKNAAVPRCTSLLDYIARVVLLHFGSEETKERLKAGGEG